MRTPLCSDEEWNVRVDLAAAHRLVQAHGWGEGIYNHIAARVPGEADKLLMKRNDITHEEVCASNLVKVDLGADLDESAHVNRPGYVLHAGIMQGRSDVGGSLHFHTPEVIAVSTRRPGLRMLSQYACRFHGRIGYHDYEGITDGLDERPRISRHLGDGIALVLRHHGAVTVGRTVAQAFVAAKYLHEACRIQLLAEMNGAEPMEIPPDVCRRTVAQFAHHDEGRGAAEWPAYLRELDNSSPGYRL